MNSKLLNHEEGKIKIDNIKNITLSDIINKKKDFMDSEMEENFNYLIKFQKIKILELIKISFKI